MSFILVFHLLLYVILWGLFDRVFFCTFWWLHRQLQLHQPDQQEANRAAPSAGWGKQVSRKMLALEMRFVFSVKTCLSSSFLEKKTSQKDANSSLGWLVFLVLFSRQQHTEWRIGQLSKKAFKNNYWNSFPEFLPLKGRKEVSLASLFISFHVSWDVTMWRCWTQVHELKQDV